MRHSFLILGCGFTGSRVALRLLARGHDAITAHRSDVDVTQPGAIDAIRGLASPGCVVLHSIPTVAERADNRLLEALQGRARRVVYLSTTGVYGDQEFVDASTVAAPNTSRTRLRLETEQAVVEGPWRSLILRPAAIYGPGRGAHVAMREGRFGLIGDGSNYTSRIHVNDLACITEAALLSDLTGTFPVADRHPCSAREIAEFCAALLHLPMPQAVTAGDAPESRRGNRRVDGSAVLRALGCELQYPSYREGIPASLPVAVR